MNVLQQPDRDIILYNADDKQFGTDKEAFTKGLEMSQHYQGGKFPSVSKEVVNLKEMAKEIESKLTKKEIFFLNYFAQSKQTSIR